MLTESTALQFRRYSVFSVMFGAKAIAFMTTSPCIGAVTTRLLAGSLLGTQNYMDVCMDGVTGASDMAADDVKCSLPNFKLVIPHSSSHMPIKFIDLSIPKNRSVTIFTQEKSTSLLKPKVSVFRRKCSHSNKSFIVIFYNIHYNKLRGGDA